MMMENLKYSEIIKQNVSLLQDVKELPLYKIDILSNITCNQLKDILLFNLRTSKLNPEIRMGNYDNIVQDSYNCQGAQMTIVHYDLVNILDKYAVFAEDFIDEHIDSLCDSIKSEIDVIIENLRSVPVVIFDAFSSYAVYTNTLTSTKTKIIARKLNEYLSSKSDLNLHVLDIDITLARVGLFDALDFRMYYLSKALYTVQYWKEYVYEISALVYKYTGKLKKAVIFDCDNTLWKGILGEDGEKGIDMSKQSKIGQIYNDVQQIAVWLSKQGVLIGLCSKNNQQDVVSVFNTHPDIVLKQDNVVVQRINWQDKVTNLEEIAKELNIGIDSIVFVDDSSFEIEHVKTQLPEILTLQVPVAIHEYPGYLLKMVDRYFYLSGNAADADKVVQYKQQSERNEEKKLHQSLEAYLATLQLEVEIKKNDFSQIERIAQLTQKTNQFNLTTQRYTESQIEQFMNNIGRSVFSVSVKDKFGESGLTAVCITKEERETVVIDSFLMSCRIMGRNVEYVIINFILDYCKMQNFNVIEASYIATMKNRPICDFYESVGFKIISKDQERKDYNLLINTYKPYNVEYIKLIK